MHPTATRCPHHSDHYLCDYCCQRPNAPRRKPQGFQGLRGPYTSEEIQELLAPDDCECHPETTIAAQSGTIRQVAYGCPRRLPNETEEEYAARVDHYNQNPPLTYDSHPAYASATDPEQLVADMNRVLETVREATTKDASFRRCLAEASLALNHAAAVQEHSAEQEMSPEWLASVIAGRIVGDCELTDAQVNALCKAIRVLGNQLLYKKTAERRRILGIQ